MGMGQGVDTAPGLLGQLVHGRAAGVGKSQHSGRLVKAFPRRIVPGRTQNFQIRIIPDAETPLAKAILYGKNNTIFKPAPGTLQTSHPQALLHQSYFTDVNTGVISGIPSVVNDKTGLTNAKSLLNFVFPTWYGSQPVASLNSDKFISDMLYFDNYNLYDTTTDAPSTIKANPTGVFGAKQGSKDALNPRVSSVNSVLPVEYDEFGNSSDYGHTFFEQAKSKSKGYALSIFATYLASDKLLATKGFQASSGG